jgi:hypothetical protein
MKFPRVAFTQRWRSIIGYVPNLVSCYLKIGRVKSLAILGASKAWGTKPVDPPKIRKLYTATVGVCAQARM